MCRDGIRCQILDIRYQMLRPAVGTKRNTEGLFCFSCQLLTTRGYVATKLFIQQNVNFNTRGHQRTQKSTREYKRLNYSALSDLQCLLCLPAAGRLKRENQLVSCIPFQIIVRSQSRGFETNATIKTFLRQQGSRVMHSR